MDIIDVLYTLAKNAPWLLSMAFFVVIVGAAFLIGNNSGSAKRIRASIDKLADSLERSERILGDLEESQDTTGERIAEAKQGVADALSIIRKLKTGNDREGGNDSSD